MANDIIIPWDCFCGVGEVWNGDYACSKIQMSGHPVVVDIGANCGAFAMWAAWKWEASKVICYEPHPQIFQYLKNNLEVFGRSHPQTQFEIHREAVGNPENCLLKTGHNRLCSTLQNGQHTTSDLHTIVEVLHPNKIPPCDVLKIDAEGSEAIITFHLLEKPKYLVCEYHDQDQMRWVINNLSHKGMMLLECDCQTTETGMLKFVRRPEQSEQSPE